MGELIRRQGGDPFVAPSMREAPIENNPEAFEFAERLFRGEFDLMIFLTGVGTRALNKVLASRYPEEQFAEALRKIAVAARGPKPLAALRELKVPVAVTAPEPNTWRELLAALERPERNGTSRCRNTANRTLSFWKRLRARGADVTPVRVYQWDLPEDLAPLREAVHRIAEGRADVAMFTTSIQIPHLFRIAAEERVAEPMQQALRRMVIASIGPTTTETLEEFGLAARHHAQPSEDGLSGEGDRRAGRRHSATETRRACLTENSLPRSAIRQILRDGLSCCRLSMLVGYRDRIRRSTRCSTPAFLKIVFLLLGVAAGMIDLVRELSKDDAGKVTPGFTSGSSGESQLDHCRAWAARRHRRGISMQGNSERVRIPDRSGGLLRQFSGLATRGGRSGAESARSEAWLFVLRDRRLGRGPGL